MKLKKVVGMIKQLFFFLLLLFSVRVNAQTAKGTDSLIMVKNYLLNIQKTVNAKQAEKQKIAKLDSLIRLATKQKAIFGRNLTCVVKNKQEAAEMKTTLNFILQSMVLYKADLKSNGESPSEILYLNKNIPILSNKIYYYCKSAQQSLK